jgi:hypothetical protein
MCIMKKSLVIVILFWGRAHTATVLFHAQLVAEDHEGWKLTEEGDKCANEGSPEALVYAKVRRNQCPLTRGVVSSNRCDVNNRLGLTEPPRTRSTNLLEESARSVCHSACRPSG